MAEFKVMEEACKRFFRTKVQGTLVCAPPLVCARKNWLVFCNASGRLQNPSAMRLGLTPLPQLLCSAKLFACRFLSLIFSVQNLLPHHTQTGASRGYGGSLRGRQTKVRCAIVLGKSQSPSPLDIRKETICRKLGKNCKHISFYLSMNFFKFFNVLFHYIFQFFIGGTQILLGCITKLLQCFRLYSQCKFCFFFFHK